MLSHRSIIDSELWQHKCCDLVKKKNVLLGCVFFLSIFLAAASITNPYIHNFAVIYKNGLNSNWIDISTDLEQLHVFACCLAGWLLQMFIMCRFSLPLYELLTKLIVFYGSVPLSLAFTLFNSVKLVWRKYFVFFNCVGTWKYYHCSNVDVRIVWNSDRVCVCVIFDACTLRMVQMNQICFDCKQIQVLDGVESSFASCIACKCIAGNCFRFSFKWEMCIHLSHLAFTLECVKWNQQNFQNYLPWIWKFENHFEVC